MRQGFTLIETLISASLSALLIGIIMLFLLKGMQSFALSQEQAEIHRGDADRECAN